MDITYTPEDGKQGKTIEKYGVFFNENETKNIENEALGNKLLTCPYFVEAIKSVGAQVLCASNKPLTAKKIKEKLDLIGIKYKSNANKPVLQSLLDEANDGKD